MKYESKKLNRHSIRLAEYDYSKAGMYFVTICTYNKECTLGEVLNGKMILNEWGKIASKCWLWLSEHYNYISLDEWIIMPNHLHGIITISKTPCRGGSGTAPPRKSDCISLEYTTARGGSRTAPTREQGNTTTGDGSRTAPTKRKPLGRLIGAFKTVSTKQINELRNKKSPPVWQRNYYDHIIRNEKSLNRIKEYIIKNPLKWEFDTENPEQIKKLSGKYTAPKASQPDYLTVTKNKTTKKGKKHEKTYSSQILRPIFRRCRSSHSKHNKGPSQKLAPYLNI